MAESDTILQLGIEAAREGNREEARSLFSLLTRQEPDNVQAWLWLAGVAESPDERRAALERVVALDPSNDMARKGLQAMGSDASSSAASGATGAGIYDAPPVAASLSDEERYAAELDNAFDDYDAVEKVGGGPRNTPTIYADDDDAAVAGGAGAAYGASSARDRVESRRSARARTYEEDEDDAPPARRRPSSVALILGGLILLLLLGALAWQFLTNRGDNSEVITDATNSAQDTSVAVLPGDPLATTPAGDGGVVVPAPDGTGGVTNTGGITNTGEPNGTGTVTDTGQVTPATPAEQPPAQPPIAGNFPDPAAANPQQVAVGTPLEASGFTYTFPNATYAASLGGAVGNIASQNGRFAIVLTLVSNNTGTEQVIPGELFVLKDAQGRVYTTNSAASEAYVQPGINADRSLEDPLPADGIAYSVALVFDVAPDATNLVLFTRPNQNQGFLVLNAVP